MDLVFQVSQYQKESLPMGPNELEAKIQELTAALSDEHGNPRPIEKIELEPLGPQVRWSVWSGGKRLQTLTARSEDLGGLMQATQILLAIATGNPAGLPKDLPAEITGKSEPRENAQLPNMSDTLCDTLQALENYYAAGGRWNPYTEACIERAKACLLEKR
jgi:hypothetical protein